MFDGKLSEEYSSSSTYIYVLELATIENVLQGHNGNGGKQDSSLKGFTATITRPSAFDPKSHDKKAVRRIFANWEKVFACKKPL